MSGQRFTRWDELVSAFMLLTRLPVASLSSRAIPPDACIWAYPVVGAVVGGIGGAVFWVARVAGLPPGIAAIWAVAACVLATGGLHEDGLADTADGLGGGSTRGRKLEIMRDSRIGPFGAIALILIIALRVLALAAFSSPLTATVALVCAGVAGRAAILAMLLVLRPARSDGLAAPLARAAPLRGLWGLCLAAPIMLLPGGVLVAAAACVAATVMARLAYRHIGGYTGDILGATEQLAECAALCAMLTRSG